MSQIAILCPHCSREGKLPESVKSLPKAVRCPGCQKQFRPVANDGDKFIVVPEATQQIRESAKRAATAIGDGLKQSAKMAKHYAESDQAKVLMEKTRRTATEIGEKAKVTVSSMQGGGTRFLENPIVIGLSMLFCFPIGLVFVWRHPRWSKAVKWSWTGAMASYLIIVSVMAAQARKADKETLTEANALWQKGDRAAAVAKYRPMLARLTEDEKPLAYGRVIDYEVENGNIEIARTLMEQAVSRGMNPIVNNQESKTLQSRVETAVSHAERASAPSKSNSFVAANDGLTPKIMTPEEVLALVAPKGLSAFDFSNGPNGESIVSRQMVRDDLDRNRNYESDQKGYVNTKGVFVKHGMEIIWRFDRNGSKYAVNYWKNGIREGCSIYYYNNGRINSIFQMKDGRIDGLSCSWYENSQMRLFSQLKNGLRTGRMQDWHEDGRPGGAGTYFEGELTGNYSEWSIDGKRVETPYKNGKVLYVSQKSNKRCFYNKLLETADIHKQQGGTRFVYSSYAPFIAVFGEPNIGNLPRTKMYPSVVGYKCSNGNLSITIVVDNNSNIHIDINPNDTF